MDKDLETALRELLGSDAAHRKLRGGCQGNYSIDVGERLKGGRGKKWEPVINVTVEDEANIHTIPMTMKVAGRRVKVRRLFVTNAVSTIRLP